MECRGTGITEAPCGATTFSGTEYRRAEPELAADDDLAVLAAAYGAGVGHILAGLLDVDGRSVVRVAAAVSVASALEVPAAVVLHALGIAATQVTGVHGDPGDTAEAAGLGRALGEGTADGVAAGWLARGGYTGPAQPLRGRRGLVTLLGPGHPVGDDVVGPAAIGRAVDELLGVAVTAGR